MKSFHFNQIISAKFSLISDYECWLENEILVIFSTLKSFLGTHCRKVELKQSIQYPVPQIGFDRDNKKRVKAGKNIVKIPARTKNTKLIFCTHRLAKQKYFSFCI